MDDHAAAVVAEHLMQGLAETFQAMLSVPIPYRLTRTRVLEAESLDAIVSEYPVVLAAALANNVSGVALGISRDMALGMAAHVQDEPQPAESLGDPERAVLRDLAEAVLGGAVAHLLESLGQDLGQLKMVRVLEEQEAAGMLSGLLGGEPVLSRVEFEANSVVQGAAVLLFSQSFEDLVPAQGTEADMGSSLISEQEMQDILGGIGLPGEEETGVGGGGAAYGENLDVVLDISLTAVARLGGIEMPLGEILGLGPGAIIEVGRLVDEPVELLVNGRLIARGEVVVVDEKFGLRITEIVSPRMRIESLR